MQQYKDTSNWYAAKVSANKIIELKSILISVILHFLQQYAIILGK